MEGMQHTTVTQMSRNAGRPHGHLGSVAFSLDKGLVRSQVLLTVEVAGEQEGRGDKAELTQVLPTGHVTLQG